MKRRYEYNDDENMYIFLMELYIHCRNLYLYYHHTSAYNLVCINFTYAYIHINFV